MKSFEVKRIHGGVLSPARQELVSEETLTLIVNGRKLLAFQCIPEMLEELAVGFLITEGLVASPADVLKVEAPRRVAPARHEVAVEANLPAERLRQFQEALVAGSSCGRALSSGQGFDPLDCRRKIDMTFRVRNEVLLGALAEFRRRSARSDRPPGTHASAIAQGMELPAFAEDVGRHNAVDKVVGACARRGIPLHDKILLTTGRVSLEVAAKALRAGLPLIASTRGPTAAAVELAQDAAIAVAGFASAGGMSVYSAAWRIALDT